MLPLTSTARAREFWDKLLQKTPSSKTFLRAVEGRSPVNLAANLDCLRAKRSVAGLGHCAGPCHARNLCKPVHTSFGASPATPFGGVGLPSRY